MPRTARLDICNLLQHVVVHGIDRCDIFRDDADRRRFLQSFSKLLVQTDTECLAWSLMSNHLHLLLRPNRIRLARFMRRLLTGYAIYFNLRHKRSGHLFQNRYKSLICEEQRYLLELIRYIHLNPLRARLVNNLSDLDRYTWSGHSVVMGRGTLAGQVTDEILLMFSTRKREARDQYRLFVSDGVAAGKREDLGSRRRISRNSLEELGDEEYDERVLGSVEFVGELRTRRELESQLEKPLEVKEIVARTCLHFGVAPMELRLKTRCARITEVRSIISYLAVREASHCGVKVGNHLNLQRAGVSVAATRGEEKVKENPAPLELIDK